MNYISRRLDEILSGEDKSEKFNHLSTDDRTAIRQILDETWRPQKPIQRAE
jgi:hypothetical protein